jgi:NADH dehydrogenase FAD-containing subunit
MGHTNPSTERRRVVIIGAGFGGLTAAKTLARAIFDVTVIDQHNYLVPTTALPGRDRRPLASRHRLADPEHLARSEEYYGAPGPSVGH